MEGERAFHGRGLTGSDGRGSKPVFFLKKHFTQRKKNSKGLDKGIAEQSTERKISISCSCFAVLILLAFREVKLLKES